MSCFLIIKKQESELVKQHKIHILPEFTKSGTIQSNPLIYLKLLQDERRRLSF